MPVDTLVCPGALVQLTTIYDGHGTLTWTHDIESGLLSDDPLNPIATPFELMNISVTSDDNCPASTGVSINTGIIFIPVTLTTDPEVFIAGSTLTLNAEVSGFSGTTFTYEWFQNDKSIGTSIAPTFTVQNVPEGPTKFKVEALTDTECSGTAEISVSPIEPQTPNVFTPNGDQTNDIFRLFYPDGLDISFTNFRVYNRWGQLVFESTDNSGWDGTYKGAPAASDVYIYHIEGTSNGAVVDLSGEITLLR